jgi:hypothetical protein
MEPPKPFIAAGLVDGTDTDLARVDLETVRAVVIFVAEPEHNEWLSPQSAAVKIHPL